MRACTVVCLVVLACLASTAAVADHLLGAQAGEVVVGLTFLPNDGAITAGEPVVARVTLTGKGKGKVTVLLGDQLGSYLRLTIRNEKAEVVAATPPPNREGMIGGIDLAPGETKIRIWIVTGLCQFTQPGRYALKLELLGSGPALPVIAVTEAVLRVAPFNAAQLEMRCEELFQPLRTHKPLGDLGMTCRTKALYSVRDDIVLPYLDWMVCEWGDRYACRAIQRVGTPRALRLLQTLQKRTDNVGQAARALPQMHMPDLSMWDVEAD